MTRRLAAALALVVVALTVAGCSGVPSSSAPQVVRTLGLGEQPPASVPAPPAGAAPRDIVDLFIKAMASSPDRHDAARAYLDTDAAQSWSDTSVTVVRGAPIIGLEDPTTHTVVVNYQQVGSLSATGVYTPVLAGDGANPVAPATYALAQNAQGQWRIHTPVPPGLFITDTDFAHLYSPRPVYFFDAAGDRLVPDLRYSAATEPALESFLLAQLLGQPRPELNTGALLKVDVATPGGQQRATVTPGSPTVVDIPGAAALNGAARRRLAAQLAYTLKSNAFLSTLVLKDGNDTVAIPDVDGPFDAGDFPDVAPVPEGGPVSATFVRGGAVVDATGKPVGGPLGTGQYALDDAVFDGDGGRTLVAGTTGGTGDAATRSLLLGSTNGLAPTGVQGPLSAPAWAPIGTSADTDEVWVAAGAQLWRVEPGRGASVVAASGRNGPLAGTITALAFSPEGTRLAMVVRTVDGTASQVWIGSVVRSGPDVRLDQVEPITPAGIAVDDVGWRSDTQLTAVGTAPGYPAGAIIDVAVDGSRLTLSVPDGLPDRPRAIAVSPRSPQQWVTVGTGSGATVWTRPGTSGSWGAPPDDASQQGYAPSFAT